MTEREYEQRVAAISADNARLRDRLKAVSEVLSDIEVEWPVLQSVGKTGLSIQARLHAEALATALREP